MVDLNGLMNRIRPELDHAIKRVLDSERFIGGEEVEGWIAILLFFPQS